MDLMQHHLEGTEAFCGKVAMILSTFVTSHDEILAFACVAQSILSGFIAHLHVNQSFRSFHCLSAKRIPSICGAAEESRLSVSIHVHSWQFKQSE